MMREVRSIPLLTGACRHPQAMTIRGGTFRPVDFPAVAMLLLVMGAQSLCLRGMSAHDG